jgi:hypothetical protein
VVARPMPEAAPVIAKRWPVTDAMAVVETRVEGMNLDVWVDVELALLLCFGLPYHNSLGEPIRQPQHS